jgi:arylsulfatase A-like enzyme
MNQESEGGPRAGALATVGRGAAGGSLAGLALFLASLVEYGGGSSRVSGLVLEHYLLVVVAANAKLAALLAGAGAFWGAAGGAALASLVRRPAGRLLAASVGALTFAVASFVSFIAALVDAPASVVVLWPYATSRLDPLYDAFPPGRLAFLATGLVALLATPPVVAIGEELARRLRPLAWRRVAGPGLIGATTVLGVAIPAALVAGRPSAPVHEPGPRPNVLVLITDSLRADRVEARRGDELVMPTLARLAHEGAHFTSCFVPTARTTESIVTLLTGTWGQTHGVRTSWTDETRLPVPALPAVLAGAGYETVVLGDWTATDLDRFHVGWEREVTPPESWKLPTFAARGGRLSGLVARAVVPERLLELAVPELAYAPGVDASRLVRRHVQDELERCAGSSRPFFMTVFTANTHAPFTARGDDHRHFSIPSYRGANRYALWARTIADSVDLQSRELARRELEQVEALYDAAARTFDEDLAATLADLDRLGLARDTIVVVLSDHGTAFYERGSFGQGNEIVSDVSNRIPLVVFDPRRPAHRVFDHVVREVDLAPTILDLAGVPAPSSMEGVSLRPCIEAGRDLGLVAYGETGLWIAKQPWQEEELDFGFPSVEDMCEVRDWSSGLINVGERWRRLLIRAQQRMVRTDRWKLVYVPTRSGYRVQLYDVTLGDAARDEASERPEVVLELMAVLAGWLGREPADVWCDPLPPPSRAARPREGGR